MAILCGDHKIGKEICDALGLKNVVCLDIHLAVGEVTTVTAKYFPEKDGIRSLPAILEKFELLPKHEDLSGIVETTCLGDEVKSFQKE